ncbi:MAG: hypothetical protein J0L73_08180 [Verrucomicrobia bacterium]|nr:hypothetical protein [Verrucomicrobiota bacterium]
MSRPIDDALKLLSLLADLDRVCGAGRNFNSLVLVGGGHTHAAGVSPVGGGVDPWFAGRLMFHGLAICVPVAAG